MSNCLLEPEEIVRGYFRDKAQRILKETGDMDRFGDETLVGTMAAEDWLLSELDRRGVTDDAILTKVAVEMSFREIELALDRNFVHAHSCPQLGLVERGGYDSQRVIDDLVERMPFLAAVQIGNALLG